MKKNLLNATLFLSLCCTIGSATAAPLVTRHVIVNDFQDQGLAYELIDPIGGSHKGYIYPGTTTINVNNDTAELLYGAYLLQYHSCGVMGWTCVSNSKVLVVSKNEEVIWEVSKDGVKITESNL